MKLLIINAAFVFALGLSACSSDGGSTTPDTGVRDSGTTEPDAGTEPQCGEGTQHQQIINADTTATTIMKMPRHPPVGPEGLP